MLPSEAHKVNAIADQLQLEPEFLALPAESVDQRPAPAPMATLAINGGRKNKIRPGDILGALTGDAGIAGNQVGKIDVFDFVTYVAVQRSEASKAQDRLQRGTIKGRKFRVRKL